MSWKYGRVGWGYGSGTKPISKRTWAMLIAMAVCPPLFIPWLIWALFKRDGRA